MKGAPGLLIAVGLGIVGAICNWIYLANKASQMEMVNFISIAEEAKINPGDKFIEAHFAPVAIPNQAARNLEKVAIKWDAKATVIGQSATKSYSQGDLVFHQDLKTPPELDIKKMLAVDERVLWIP